MAAYEPKNPKHLANYFDPHNEEHCRAYKELLYSPVAVWPDWFKNKLRENEIVFHDYWESLVRSKIVEVWLTHKVGGAGA